MHLRFLFCFGFFFFFTFFFPFSNQYANFFNLSACDITMAIFKRKLSVPGQALIFRIAITAVEMGILPHLFHKYSF